MLYLHNFSGCAVEMGAPGKFFGSERESGNYDVNNDKQSIHRDTSILYRVNVIYGWLHFYTNMFPLISVLNVFHRLDALTGRGRKTHGGIRLNLTQCNCVIFDKSRFFASLLVSTEL